MDAYADSLRNRNRTLNIQLNRLIGDLDIQAQNAFVQREREIAEAQALSVRLFTATISAAIILLFLSYLAVQSEIHKQAVNHPSHASSGIVYGLCVAHPAVRFRVVL